MSDTPTSNLTAPEQVERLISEELTEIARSKGMPVTTEDVAACKLAAATLRALSAKLEAAEAERDAALGALEKLQRDEWSDRPDDLTPQVKSDFRSEGFFQRHDRAMVLVSNRHSKRALVSLVAFLLREGDE